MTAICLCKLISIRKEITVRSFYIFFVKDLDLQQLSVLQDEVSVKREKNKQLQAEINKLKNDLQAVTP